MVSRQAVLSECAKHFPDGITGVLAITHYFGILFVALPQGAGHSAGLVLGRWCSGRYKVLCEQDLGFASRVGPPLGLHVNIHKFLRQLTANPQCELNALYLYDGVLTGPGSAVLRALEILGMSPDSKKILLCSSAGQKMDNSSSFRCQDAETQMHNKILYANIGVALSIWMILSLTQCHPNKLWKWAPGMAIPINAIHTSPHRMVYLLAFSGVSGDLLSLILDRKPLFVYGVELTGYSTQVATLLSNLLAIADGVLTIVVESIVYLPLFACIDAPVPVVGYILGIISVPLLAWRQVLVVTGQCLPVNSIDFWIQLALVLPIMLCLCAQFIWFCWRLVWTLSSPIRGGPSHRAALFEHKATTYHVCRVKSLLEGSSRRRQRQKSVTRKVLNFIYPYDSNIHLPLKFLAAVVVMTYATYWLTLRASYGTISIAVFLEEVLSQNSSLVEWLQKDGIINSFILGLGNAAEVVLPVAPVVAFMWNLVNLMFMVRQVRIHIQKIARGDLSFVASVPSPDPPFGQKYAIHQLPDSLLYWGFIFIVAALAGMVGYICYFVVHVSKGPTNYFFLVTAAVPLVYSLIVKCGQLIFVKLLFVGDTNNKNTVIKNAKLFHVFSYFLFFHNIIVGLASSLLNTILRSLFGLLFFFRLDRDGCNNSDEGRSAYISFLYVEHTQNNSVVHAFVDVVRAAVKERAARECTTQEDLPVSTEASERLLPEDVPQRMPTGRSGRRWHVAYTKLRNPGVRSPKDTFIKFLQSGLFEYEWVSGKLSSALSGIAAEVVETSAMMPCVQSELLSTVVCKELNHMEHGERKQWMLSPSWPLDSQPSHAGPNQLSSLTFTARFTNDTEVTVSGGAAAHAAESDAPAADRSQTFCIFQPCCADKQISVPVSDEEMQLMIFYNQRRIHYQCTMGQQYVVKYTISCH
ncbi:hypothetical protein EMCRGX_G022415 [Ephydatia muelleri]